MEAYKRFDEYLHKMKFITRTRSEKALAKELGINPRTFHDMKKNEIIPIEETLEYCKDRQIDFVWVTNLHNK